LLKTPEEIASVNSMFNYLRRNVEKFNEMLGDMESDWLRDVVADMNNYQDPESQFNGIFSFTTEFMTVEDQG
jgi:hypothetical protein